MSYSYKSCYIVNLTKTAGLTKKIAPRRSKQRAIKLYRQGLIMKAPRTRQPVRCGLSLKAQGSELRAQSSQGPRKSSHRELQTQAQGLGSEAQASSLRAQASSLRAGLIYLIETAPPEMDKLLKIAGKHPLPHVTGDVSLMGKKKKRRTSDRGCTT